MNIDNLFWAYMAVSVFLIPAWFLRQWLHEWDCNRRRSKKEEGEE